MSIAEEYEERLADWSDIKGHMPFLRDTAASYAAPVMAELGTRGGQSTCALLAGIAGNGGRLWSVDKDDAQVPGHWREMPQWRFLQADDCSTAAQQWLPPVVDVLFIDTSHEYEHTLAELRIYMPRVRKGGIALFHDTQFAPPGEDLEKPVGDVAKALDAYCAEAGLAWENRPGYYGLGVIRL